jgi:predicted DNA binding CopG/RHH family protein
LSTHKEDQNLPPNFSHEAARSGTKKKEYPILLAKYEYWDIESKAYENGIPYQTLMGTILHQYANDRLTAAL